MVKTTVETASQSTHTTRAGLGWAFVSAATFGLSGVIAKPMMDAGWSAGTVVLVRLFIAAVALAVPGIYYLRRDIARHPTGLLRDRAALARLIGFGVIAVASCQFCFFQSVRYLPVGVALLLEFTGPLLVVGWLWFYEKNRPRSAGVLGMLLAMFGLVLVLDPFGPAPIPVAGVLWGLGAAIGNAGFFLLSRGGATPIHPVAQNWLGMMIGGVTLGAVAAVGLLDHRTGAASVDVGGGQISWLAMLLVLGLFTTAIPYVAGTLGVRLLGSRVSSFVGLTEVLFAVLFSWMILAESPTWAQAGGGVLVLAGVSLVKIAEPEPAPIETIRQGSAALQD